MAFTRPTQPLRIGAYLLDPGLNALRRDDEEQRLPPRLVDLLLRLAQSPGQCVTRETLIDEVWERRQVNDEVLSRAIADLRQALGDDARAPRYIETLPKLGYRVVAPVEVVAAPPPDAAPRVVDAGPERRPGGFARRVFPALLVLLALALAATGTWRWRGADPATARADPLTAANLLRARPFTTEPGRELFPRFTPDGRWVIYARAAPGAPAVELRLRAVDGTEDRVLAEGGGDNFCGVVSPDGVHPAWLRARPGICELAVRPLLGGTARVLAGCNLAPLASCPEWRRDGRGLWLASGAEGARGVQLVAFPEARTETLTSPPTGSHDMMPRESPTTDALVFLRGDSSGRVLHRLDLASGRVEALRDQTYLAFGHAFASGGDLVIADDSFGQRALLRLAPRAGATPVLLGGADARHPDVSRDGALVYEVARYDANLWRIALDGSEAEPRRLTTSARYDSQPSVSPDAAWIAFGSNRDGREAIYLMRADGSEERKLPLDPALRWTSPTWSPDGKRLLVMRYAQAGPQLCLYRIASGNSECPADFGRGLHAAFFLDHEAIGAIDAVASDAALWRLEPDGRRTRIEAAGRVDRCRASRAGSPAIVPAARASGCRIAAAARRATSRPGSTPRMRPRGPSPMPRSTSPRRAAKVSSPASIASTSRRRSSNA
jgi:DNA-binding winged helix-turn-helix (wHTH) protein/Tol biopolymer transport system component